MLIDVIGDSASPSMPLVQEISSFSEEIVVVSPSPVADVSPLRLVGEQASTPSISPRSVRSPLSMAKVNLVVSEAADEGPTVVLGEELGVEEGLERHDAIANDESSSPMGEEEPTPIERPEAILLDNRDEDMGNEGLNASQKEGPNERSEQLMVIFPDDPDGEVRDEGISIA
ncbi:hypothetical protein AMTR_s00034p00180510 [Amborella trichopoda]|uniref:Uncharacterized protein n=1 Tax=Amborella trichopoda TaxID=13333 RepID=W1PVW0_AMBTC|nr:hypothetical protein AMTR_s00034p00180510 [Amborella trichopoda]